MSLIKKPRMTEKKLAAIRRNQKLSHGPATPEGRARIRDARLKHGFYSQSDEAALRALGEDLEEFRETVAGLKDPDAALAVLQARLGEALAGDLLRMRRAIRMQEGKALNTAREQDAQREGRLHMQMMRVKMVSRNWQLVARAVAREHYVTTPAHLKMMKELHEQGTAKEMSEVALALFWQLREPGTAGPGDPNFEQEEEYAKAQRVVQQVKEIFGIGMSQPPRPRTPHPAEAPAQENGISGAAQNPLPQPLAGAGSTSPSPVKPEAEVENPYPNITEEQWQRRETARQLLENLLTRQVEIFDAQHRELLRQVVAGPSPQDRAAEVAPIDPADLLAQRLENSSFDKVSRMTGLLIRLKRLEKHLRDRDDTGSETML